MRIYFYAFKPNRFHLQREGLSVRGSDKVEDLRPHQRYFIVYTRTNRKKKYGGSILMMCFVCKYLQLPLLHINVSFQTKCHQGPIKSANAWGHELLGQGPSSAWNPGFRREGNFPKDSKEHFWQIRLNPVCLKCALENPVNCFWPLTDNQQKCVSQGWNSEFGSNKVRKQL